MTKLPHLLIRSIFCTKCEYDSKCAAYRTDSYTCTKELNKHYCGIYRQFAQGTINVYIAKCDLEPHHQKKLRRRVPHASNNESWKRRKLIWWILSVYVSCLFAPIWAELQIYILKNFQISLYTLIVKNKRLLYQYFLSLQHIFSQR